MYVSPVRCAVALAEGHINWCYLTHTNGSMVSFVCAYD